MQKMKNKSPFRFIRPHFFSGLIDDPVLIIRILPASSNIMVDCGQINHIASKVLKSVDAVFITHAHMDHFMGIDHFTRTVLVTEKTIDLFGPPGIAEKLENKLKGYDWNLAEDFFCKYRIHEIFPERKRLYFMDGAKKFRLEFLEEKKRSTATIFKNRYIIADADFCDHKIPSLLYRFSEPTGFNVNRERVHELGLVPGAWLDELKKRFYDPDEKWGKIMVLKKSGGIILETQVSDSRELYRSVSIEQDCASLGYLTDIGFTEKNMEKIESLLKGVSLLFCECTYLDDNIEKARISYHLCTSDINHLIGILRPEYIMPMHLSRTYIERSEQMYSEIKPIEGCSVIRLPERMTFRPKGYDELPLLFNK